MKPVILNFLCASFLFAQSEINVVPCEDALRDYPEPKNKIIGKVLFGLEKSPTQWVCAYAPCDYEKKYGWFAINKNGNVVFEWDRYGDSTTTWYVDEKDEIYYLNKITYNKYGIRKFDSWYYTKARKNELESIINSLLADRDCPQKRRTVKLDCVPGTAFCNK